MGKRSLRAIVVLMFVLASLLAIGGIALAQDSSISIYDNLANAGNFTTLTSAIDEKGLTETYTGDGSEYTLFAPNDAAFQALSVADRIKLYRNPETLVQTLNHMTVEGVYLAADLTDGLELTALDGGTLTITHDGDKILVNGAEIVLPDQVASNGVIQVVGSVIPLEGTAAPAADTGAEGEAVADTTTVTTTAVVTTEAAVTTTEMVTTTEVATATAEPAEEATAAPAEEATAAPIEEATAAPAEEATAAPAEEATSAPAEEATAAPAEEATAGPAEEATAVPAEEATAVPAEEATAAPAEEATLAPAEEATAAPAEEAAATPEPTEEAPEELPATGAEANSMALVAAALVTLLALGAFTFVSRRRM